MNGKKVFTPDIAKKMGNDFGLTWKEFDEVELANGLNVELEHGLVDPVTNVSDDDPLITLKIALAHLNEFPDYYTRLDKMEDEAEEYWAQKNI